jgi:hypothetical protein
VVTRERRRALLYILVLLFLGWVGRGIEDAIVWLAVVGGIGLTYAVIGRVVAWYFEGSAVRAILEAFGFTLFGGILSALLTSVLTSWLGWDFARGWLYIAILTITLPASAVIGAILASRNERGPNPCPRSS